MAYIEVTAFKKLKAFFWGLRTSGFNLNKVPARDQEGTPIDKTYCLNLLHSFPDFQEERFKDDNFLVRHLAKPDSIRQILDQFTPSQQIELTKILAEKPIIYTQNPDQITDESPATMTGGSLPQMPNFSSGSTIHSVPRVLNPADKFSGGKAGGTGTGTAATNKSSSNPKFQAPKIPYAASNAGKNFGSATQRFMGTNLGRIGRSLGQIAGGVGRNIGGPMLNSSYHGLGKFGNGAINSFARLSDSSARLRSTAGSFKPAGSKKWLWGLMGGFLLFFFFDVFSSGITGTTPTTSASPIGSISPQNGLDYTLPLRDSSVVPFDIKAQIKAAFSNAKLENWEIIIKESKLANWNPAFVLALWIEESGAQGAASYTDPLGCAPLQPTTDINVSLNCLFKNFSNFTNDQFSQFMAKYSGGPADNPFSNNPNFTKNIKDWYSRLVPSGAGAMTMIIATDQPFGCPIQQVINDPYGFNIQNYSDSNEGCNNLSGALLSNCHNGIDIDASVGTNIKSTINGVIKTNSYDSAKGFYLEISNNSYTITYEHLNTAPNLKIGDAIQKGTIIGESGSSGNVRGPHLHYKIKKDGQLINPLRYVGPLQSPIFAPLVASDEISANDYSGAPIGTTFNFGYCGTSP